MGESSNGKLAPGVLPGLLRSLYVGRRTGLLHVSRGDERRSVRFRKGQIARAETNVASERLGETLVEQGELSPEDLARATEVVIREKKKLGAVLQELGIMTKDRLDGALAVHVREMLRRLFAWTDGSYTFEEVQSEAPVEGDISMRLSTGELILEAVAAIQDPAVIRRELGSLGRTLTLSLDPMLRFQNITLTPADGFLLSRVDGQLTAREVMDLAGMPAEEAERSLFGLLSVGVVEYGSEAGAARPSAPLRLGPGTPSPQAPAPRPSPPAPRPAPESPKPAAQQQPQRPTAPRVEPAPSMPPPARSAPAARPASPPDTDAAEKRREIETLYEGLRTLSHFEVLGIERSADEAQVKAAYFKLARRFHPDSHTDPALEDLEDKIEAIFIRVGDAYGVLRDREKRTEYEMRLPRARTASTPAAPVAAEPETPTGPDPYQAAAIVGGALKSCAKLFEEEKYYDAIQLLEQALPFAPNPKTAHKLKIPLARAYAKNPHWGKRAEEQILEVLNEDPRNVDANYTLAMLYRDKGLKARSLSMFRKVLELSPEHPGALAAVGPTEPEPRVEGGLLKKLFKKG
jgi:curved DNA-binding protein CbpA